MDDYLPISMLNQLEYCERRFYLMHVMGEMEVNAHVLEGTFRHEKAHTAGRGIEDGVVTQRKVYVWSDELRIAGFADVVEEIKDEVSTSSGTLIPVEYKKGRMGKWMNDHIQLCAQALCIAERTGAVVPKGYIFYFGSRHREEVEFTLELRQRTVQSIERAHQIVTAHRLPPPLENYNKCRDCSLEPVCLPREIKMLIHHEGHEEHKG
ncbi:MAG: CRISPR-associated protein Cas4 [Chloroflexi bacterium]|nr:CRISPR-associated protein Cas4 [Chloroflexota bacterium]MDL1940944.1 CRISPR-associated protein Cas4 [Chloroflexi bacterium CFX2]